MTRYGDYLGTLAVGQVYLRSDLHRHLGGERQRGISYPADGNHVLLFSDPSDQSHGYHDGWLEDGRGYRYWGMWYGPGPMTPTRGNAAVVKRSPQLYLFVRDRKGHRFEGRFAVRRQVTDYGSNDDRREEAIVFVLERVA